LHLLSQRGHRGACVFRGDEDFALYVEALRFAATEQLVAVHAYALTDDAVFLLVTPTVASSLSRMLQSIGRRFGAEINRRRGVTGSLWEGRFRCAVVDPTHLMDCVRFVESAPLTAESSADPAAYRWSSAAHHAGRRLDPAVTDHPLYWQIGNTPFEREARHRALVQEPLPPTLASNIAEAVQRSKVLGPPEFVAAVGTLAGRSLTGRPRGRPRKELDR